MASELVAGVDGAPEGWVACIVEVDGNGISFSAAATLAQVWDPTWAVVAIDMPIGLPSGEPRTADGEARAILRHRRSTLFRTPDHAVLAANDYAQARRSSVEACGTSLMKQAFNLLPKIIEVRDHLGGPQPHVHEVHPESSFTVMNGGEPLLRKASATGLEQRAALVAAWRPPLAPMAAGLSVDALDAAAAAWTAERILRGEHLVLGADDGTDPDGYPLTMAV